MAVNDPLRGSVAVQRALVVALAVAVLARRPEHGAGHAAGMAGAFVGIDLRPKPIQLSVDVCEAKPSGIREALDA